jgi:hypothetical protein
MLVSSLTLGCEPHLLNTADSGSPGDPNELSFGQGEVLEIEDQEGKWWQARKADGTLGSKPFLPSFFIAPICCIYAGR